MKTILTIAGSDSGGGAGIQADLKTFAAHSLHGLSVITAVTAQNSVGVIGIQDVKPDIVHLQLKAVFDDFKITSVKIGMVSSVKIIKIIAETLKLYKPSFIVLDPVMVAQSGAVLIKPTAINALKKYLFPIADVVTPNIPEFEKLFNKKIHSLEEAEKILAGKDLPAILVKGGHLKNTAKDILFYNKKFFYFNSDYVKTKNLHGTGCTLSSAIASNYVLYKDIVIAVTEAKKYLYNAIKNSYKIGKGPGPLKHIGS